MKKLVGILAILLVVAGLSYKLTGSFSSIAAWLPRPASTAPSRYITAPIERGNVVQTVSTTGSLNALVTVEVGTQLSGQVAELFADFNDYVRKAQPLAQLDRISFEAHLAEARASTSVAEATVVMQRARVERARIETLDAEAQRAVLLARVDSARAQLEAASSSFERSKALLEKGTASSSQFEQAQATRDSAAANLREAEAIAAAHEHVVEGAKVDFARSAAELEIALASVPQKKAAERSIEIDLERTTIRSPIDGVVVGRKVNEGQTVAASLEAPVLFTIAGDLQRMEIYARVDESDIGKIRVGQTAQFTVDAYPAQRFAAAVSGIRKAPEVTQNVVTYTVVLATTNPDNLLLPGMTAAINIVRSEERRVGKECRL